MKSAIKKAIVTTLLGLSLGFVGMGSARAAEFTPKDVAELAEEIELSYQPEAIDCQIAGKIASKGYFWAVNQKHDISPERAAMEATFEVLRTDLGVMDKSDYIDKENLRKGLEEIRETYEGFFLLGADFGNGVVEVNGKDIKARKFYSTQKERREAARKFDNDALCEGFKERNKLVDMVALYRLAAGKF